MVLSSYLTYVIDTYSHCNSSSNSDDLAVLIAEFSLFALNVVLVTYLFEYALYQTRELPTR
jgi:hypothetical protein